MRVSLVLMLLVSAAVSADEIVVVTRDGCMPCASLKRDLEDQPQLVAGHDVTVLEGQDAMTEWRVSTVPTIIRLRGRREVARRTGYWGPRDFVAWLRRTDRE